jgi:Uma2 family endonuclease
VKLVWIIDPDGRQAFVYRQSGGRVMLSETDEITGEDVISGFHCQLSELFALPPGVA